MPSSFTILTIALILGEGLSLEPGVSPGFASKVEKETYAALTASPDGRVHVLINLAPPGRNEPYPSQAVKDLEQEVLDSLGGQFELGYRFKTFAGLTGRITREGLDRLAAHRSVVSVGLDRKGKLAGPAGPAAPNAYIEATRVHEELGITGRGITVAVIDTGVRTSSADLSGSIADGAHHFTGQGADVGPGAEDSDGHGTIVATIITGNGVGAPRGIAPDADVLPISIFPNPFASDLTAAIDHVVSHKGSYAKLAAINMSLAFSEYSACPCDEEDTTTRMFQSAILAAREAGILCFVAPGNDDSCDSMYTPACVSAANSVGAVYPGDDGTLLPLGNRNECLTISAPGGPFSGVTATSWSTPHGTALAALMSEADSCGSETPATVVRTMKETGITVSRGCGEVESTVINAFRAVSTVLETQTTEARVARDLSQETYAPGETISVHLTVVPDSPDAEISVVEVLPAGMEAAEVSDGGVQAEDKIHWILRSSSTRTLSYKLSPPPCAGDLVFGRSLRGGPGPGEPGARRAELQRRPRVRRGELPAR